MNARNSLIALASAIVGGLVVAFAMSAAGPTITAKSDRLGGSSSETAFLKERFAVPASTQ